MQAPHMSVCRLQTERLKRAFPKTSGDRLIASYKPKLFLHPHPETPKPVTRDPPNPTTRHPIRVRQSAGRRFFPKAWQRILESMQRVIIIRVMAQSHHHHESHCRELSSFAQRSHHQSHCTKSSSSEPLQRVIIIRVIAQSHHHHEQSHSRESLARSNACESHWRGAMLMRVICKEQCWRESLARSNAHESFHS